MAKEIQALVGIGKKRQYIPENGDRKGHIKIQITPSTTQLGPLNALEITAVERSRMGTSIPIPTDIKKRFILCESLLVSLNLESI